MKAPDSNLHPWLLWQLIDSSLPVGGFAHSGGLEAAVQLGEVRTENDPAAGVEAFVKMYLRQFARSAGPYALGVFDRPTEYEAIDQAYDVFLNNSVANRASRAQGQALITVVADVWPGERVAEVRAALRQGTIVGHWPVIFAVVARELRVSRTEMINAIFYIQMRGILSAAVRLNVIGPLEAQRVQVRLGEMRITLVQRMKETSIDEAASTAPILDLIQSQHERLYSRLFIS